MTCLVENLFFNTTKWSSVWQLVRLTADNYWRCLPLYGIPVVSIKRRNVRDSVILYSKPVIKRLKIWNFSVENMENISLNKRDLKIKIPSGMIISGPSSSGKTTLLLKILNTYQDFFVPVPKTILYCYSEYHSYIPLLEKSGIKICHGVPSDDLLKSMPKPLLLVLDDLLLTMNDKTLSELFTKKSHHQNIVVIFITQNLFDKSLRVARTNAQYIILMRAPNAALQIRNLVSFL